MKSALAVATILACLIPAIAARADTSDLWQVRTVLTGHSLEAVRDGAARLLVLHGVRAPKIETPDGIVARECLEELTRGQQIAFDVKRSSDRLTYATVKLEDGTDLAGVLLANGFVEWDRIAAADRSDYETLEASAKEKCFGIWNPQREMEMSKDEAPLPPLTEPGSREAFVDEHGTTVLRMKGNESPDYAVRARASQEKFRRMEQRAEAFAEQERLRAELIEQQRIAEAQAVEQARRDYQFYLESEQQRLQNEYWRRMLYHHHYHSYRYIPVPIPPPHHDDDDDGDPEPDTPEE